MIIRSFLYNILYVVITFFVAFTCSLLSKSGLISRRFAVSYLRLWVKVIFFIQKIILGISYKVFGKENYNGNGPAIIACNHQSVWETMVFHILSEDPAYWMKKELINLPFFGESARFVGMISVNQNSGRRELAQILEDTKKAVTRKQTVIIFPEGTRVNSKEVVEYGCGVYLAYKKTNLPVIPVSINSGKCFPVKTLGVYYSGVISVKYHKAIYPGLKKDKFMALLRERIEGKY